MRSVFSFLFSNTFQIYCNPQHVQNEHVARPTQHEEVQPPRKSLPSHNLEAPHWKIAAVPNRKHLHWPQSGCQSCERENKVGTMVYVSLLTYVKEIICKRLMLHLHLPCCVNGNQSHYFIYIHVYLYVILCLHVQCSLVLLLVVFR